jgi:GAF domain-containing protein
MSSALAQASVPTASPPSRYQSLLSSPQCVLDAIPGAVCICSADGAVVRFNRTAISLWGRTPVAGGAEERFCGAFRLLQLDGTYLSHAETPMATVLRTGEPLRDREVIIERPNDGSQVIALVNIEPLKDASGRVQGAINCFQDITTRKRAESALDTRAHRLSMLNRVARTLSSDMDLQQIVQAVTDRATELTGAKFGAFFYNVTETDGERYLLYTLSGAPRAAFDGFGLPRNTALFGPTFRGETVVRCDDVRKDRRYGLSPPHYGMPKGHLPVVSYLAVPVISRSGEVHGGLFFAHDKPGVFTAEAEELVTGIAAHAAVAIDNARLLQAAAKRADQQTALYQFTDRLQRAETLTDICEAALDAILHASKCDRASILELDSAGVMRFVASRGLSEAYRKAVEGHSPWLPDAENPKPICIPDVAAAELGPDSSFSAWSACAPRRPVAERKQHCRRGRPSLRLLSAVPHSCSRAAAATSPIA